MCLDFAPLKLTGRKTHQAGCSVQLVIGAECGNATSGVTVSLGAPWLDLVGGPTSTFS